VRALGVRITSDVEDIGSFVFVQLEDLTAPRSWSVSGPEPPVAS